MDSQRTQGDFVDVRSITEYNWNVFERPSARDVQEQCLDLPFLHSICHGVSDSKDPINSHLRLWQRSDTGKGCLEDLTFSQIFDWTMKLTCIAFLTSCYTADASEPTLLEENIDNCDTLNLVVVHDVVGSMWPVPDAVAAEMAGNFWQFSDTSMLDREYESCRVAQALNGAPMMTSG